MPRGVTTHPDPNFVKNVNTFMKRASICASSRKGYNSNLNIMFQHMVDNKELFDDYILCGDEDDAYNDNLQCYFPIGAVRSAQIKLVAPLPLNLLIEHEKSIMMFIATDTSKAMKRNNVAIEEDFQGMVIGDDNDDENDVEIIDEDGGYVDDVPVTVRRANDDDDDNN